MMHPCVPHYSLYYHHQCIKAETKWPSCSRRHSQMHFVEWKCTYICRLKIIWSLIKRVQRRIPALVQIMAWRRPGDIHYLKLLWLAYRPYMRHSAPISLNKRHSLSQGGLFNINFILRMIQNYSNILRLSNWPINTYNHNSAIFALGFSGNLTEMLGQWIASYG